MHLHATTSVTSRVELLLEALVHAYPRESLVLLEFLHFADVLVSQLHNLACKGQSQSVSRVEVVCLAQSMNRARVYCINSCLFLERFGCLNSGPNKHTSLRFDIPPLISILRVYFFTEIDSENAFC